MKAPPGGCAPGWKKFTGRRVKLGIHEEYRRWLAWPGLEPALLTELQGISGDDAAINDRFWRQLAFGTGGLRGVLGAGTNRMNRHTVARATRGLADWLLAGQNHTAAIAWDSRNFSRAFAECAAGVLCAAGIKVYLFEDLRPTPMLSFAVRLLGCGAGIVITASHNPRQYNGYKVYGPDGGQITDEAAAAVGRCIDAHAAPGDIPQMPLDEARAAGRLEIIGEAVDAAYYAQVKALVTRKQLVAENAASLRILYTPLHGSGNRPVRRVLAELGFSQVSVVAAQEAPNGDFPTTPRPNPEEPEVYTLAIEQAKRENPDLIFATDPDCDRIGVLVRDSAGDFSVLSGNQVGALLCDYLITAKREQGALPANAAVVKTIVTTELARAICAANDVALAETLTGFKYIGEAIGRWEETGAHSFLLGFEESYGYLAGTFVRDKDAVIAAALIAEMTLWHKQQGRGLGEALQQLYKKYGYTAEKLVSIEMEGEAGARQIAAAMDRLREGGLSGEAPAVTEDYKTGLRTGPEGSAKLDFPPSNVLKYIFSDGSWMAFRPSGTEPKLKIYVGSAGITQEAAESRLARLVRLAQAQLD